ncbi:glutamine synthetase beta-grasp domain-containing protein, partial [Parasutterella excrementihominis]
MAKTSAEIMQMLVDNNVKFVDLRFTDFKGKEQHVSVPVSAFDEDKFEEGHAFDGSSIAGWKGIEASDMLLMPDPDSARMDPFADEDIPTMILTCNVVEPSTGKGYDRDPRSVANRAEAYLKSTGIGDNAYFGPEPEFFIFNGVSWGTTMNHSFFKIESEEGYWSNGKDMNGANSGHRPTVKGGYFPVPPVDSLYNVRSQMCELLEEQGVPVEVHHHE